MGPVKAIGLSLLTIFGVAIAPAWGESEQVVACEILIAGGGLAGTAAAYEALLAGRTVCLTEITDWIGGQISAQGTSALDERTTQRQQNFFPRGYQDLRSRLAAHYGRLSPGNCWVSEACFLPGDGDRLLHQMLAAAARKGRGKLHWFPNTVIKDLAMGERRIEGAIAIQHRPAPGTAPLNTEPLSAILLDAYDPQPSPRLDKTLIRFVPAGENWIVIEATETGELLPLAQVPYRLGIDPRSPLEPSSSSDRPDPYCTQGFTYTFAMAATADPQPQTPPPFYDRYAPYYSYELPRLANFNLVFTYRRIWDYNLNRTGTRQDNRLSVSPGDISMQNWTWGNDYRPGTAVDNLIYTHQQLQALGQLEPGQWQGGLRVETLQAAEELALGYYYWLVAGTTDSQLGDGVKQPHPNHRYLQGFDSPMGTAHGLSKYPYMREGRRIIGRPSPGYPDGFTVAEIDISRTDYEQPFYRETLNSATYRALRTFLAGRQTAAVVADQTPYPTAPIRRRAAIFPDSVGIGHYAIDFHPCMALSPPEKPGNFERPGERQGAGAAYPFQIPLRAMIPQDVDNLLVAGKSIATSHIAAAAYRVHSFEWSAGAAAGTVADFTLRQGILPPVLIEGLPRPQPLLRQLQGELDRAGNHTTFPDTSIFNEDWQQWR
ncbi:MAG: FAD-dependent oxidoreductase [Spirulina sp. DLM2.Bin59]|nr:MAG: FAD-dependent oxidoreductase [Spirulina sp. DLM2.Bin59]